MMIYETSQEKNKMKKSIHNCDKAQFPSSNSMIQFILSVGLVALFQERTDRPVFDDESRVRQHVSADWGFVCSCVLGGRRRSLLQKEQQNMW